MHKITIAGTSRKLKDIVNTKAKIILRTEISDAAGMLKEIGTQYETLDDVYEKAGDFDELDILLAERVVKSAQDSDVLYIVPGSALSGDGSVKEIKSRYENIEFIAGSAPEYELLGSLFEADASSGYSSVPAACLERGSFSSRLPLIITALDNEYLLGEVKLLLCEEYGDEHTVFIGSEKSYRQIKLYEMDRLKQVDHNTSMYVPVKSERARYDGFELEQVFKKLRSPEGCPWDREQTHESLKRYLLEECAEVLDAIDGGDMYELMDELGDVLLQVLFHATIAAERGDFDMRDVTDNLVRKLIKRHPHVFGDANADDPDAVLEQWDAIKHEDKEDKSMSAKLKSVPNSMPALMRAQKVVSRAKKAEFFKTPDVPSVIAGIDEKLTAIKAPDADTGTIIGSILLDMSQLGAALDVEGELFLRDAINKYIEEFEEIEDNITDI